MGDNQAAMVTGASSGIGRDIARELARRGYHLILVARRRERLEELAEELRGQGRRCVALDCDLVDRPQRDALMGRARDWLASENLRLAVLVNNAGAGVWDYFVNQSRETSQRDIDLDVAALTMLCHDFVAMTKDGDEPAYILNIASLAGILPTPRYAVYAACKSYVRQFSRILRHELRDTPVSVTCVCPGGVKTEFLDLAGQELKRNTGMMTSEEVARLSVKAMLRRKAVYIPGLMNRISTVIRVLPLSWRASIVEKSMLVAVKEK